MGLSITLNIGELLNILKVQYERILFLQRQFYFRIWDSTLTYYIYILFVMRL